jgi:ketosteroid isomerase-like protein
VGAAELQDVHVKPMRDYIEVRARLARPVAADPALAKERLVLVVTALSDSTIEAEFHLKTNFVFDLRMRDGRVVLTRVP